MPRRPSQLATSILLTAVGLALVATGSQQRAWAQSAPDPIYSLGDSAVDPAALERWPLAPLTRAYIPEAIDLSAHFPPPGDQKKMNACVAWSTGYAARSYYTLVASGASAADTGSIISPAHLHNLLTSSSKSGSCLKPEVNIPAALEAMMQHDVQSLASYPLGNICAAPLPPEAVGKGFRIKGMQRVGYGSGANGSGETRTGLERDSLDRMRIKLSKGHPVLLSLLVGQRLMSLKANEIYTGSIHKTGELASGQNGGHAVVLTGYDDRREAFQMLNSWGPQWADGGYGWISYDTVLSDARYAFVMEPFVEPPRPVPTRPVGRVGELVSGAGLECSQISISPGTDGTVAISGFVSRQAQKLELERLAKANETTSKVALKPWPICEAMLTLREPLRAPSRPKVTLAGGDRPLKVGEAFSIEVAPPDVATFLYVFYLEDDGTVVNLLPRQGLIRAQTPAKGPLLIFGDGQSGRQTFRVTPLRSLDLNGQPRATGDPERGHEAVVAIAARAPIAELEAREGAANGNYRISSKIQPEGPADRLFLSVLKDIVFKREAPDKLPREVSADILHLRIID